MRPLAGHLVVDLTRYLPGPLASRELLRLGARVVRLEPPTGDPLRNLAPEVERLLNAGKESVACDLKAEPELGRALCARADVVLEGFRPGVAERLGVGPDDVPPNVVYCSITGFGLGGRHAARAGHDLTYLAYAGALAATAPALPPVQAADATGALTATVQILAALLERERTGRGARLVVSLADCAHLLASAQTPGLLTGRLACYRIYETADGRHLAVGALESHFFARLCELLDLEHLAPRQYDPDAQEEIADAIAAAVGAEPLAHWVELFEDEDVAVGPVATLEEAARDFTEPPAGLRAARLGEHTEAWRRELGVLA